MAAIFAPMDIIEELRRAANQAGSQKALAAQLGVSTAYLSDVILGRKAPGEAILAPLGIERVVIYRKRETTQ